MKLLHLAREEPASCLFPPAFRDALAEFGELTIVPKARALAESEVVQAIRENPVLLTGWGHIPIPLAIAENPGNLAYICHITGEMRRVIPVEIIRAGIPVTNWGDTPAFPVAEGALSLLLACLKELRPHIEEKRAGLHRYSRPDVIGTMRGLRLGLYGFGAIGRKFCAMCQPLGPQIAVFDPFVTELPEGVTRADSLRTIFATSDAIAIHAALTPETHHSVTAELLALLPDNGIVVNTARGAVVDQEALFAELQAGRLRAGLDVLAYDDSLPPTHPARHWPNLLWTSHQITYAEWPPRPDTLSDMHMVALDNLRRFASGQPVRFCMDEARYMRST